MTAALIAMQIASMLVLLPAVVLAVQVFFAERPGSEIKSVSGAVRPVVAVLVPAHNEQLGVAATLRALKPQLNSGDRLLVVADNCSDETARVAAQEGAEVIQRENTELRGKGYALDFGIRHLRANPPEVLIIVDADCIAHPGAIDALSVECATCGQPAQAVYLMEPSCAGAGTGMRMAQFAWRVHNLVRPLGSMRLGWPCQLMGTGMAFLWPVIDGAPVATNHIAEDMQLGAALALGGHSPRFVPKALVTSRFPSTIDGARSQRTRWEHGHLSTLFALGPRLLLASLTRRRWELMAMALDMMIPPLALLTMALTGLFIMNVTLGGLIWHHWLPAVTSGVAISLTAAAIVRAWSLFGRDLITLRELTSAPWYAMSKLSIYLNFILRRQSQWVRAKRDGE